jgi:hypothetical protein
MRTCAPRGRADSFKASIIGYLDWQTRSIKILAFKTAKVARISEMI